MSLEKKDSNSTLMDLDDGSISSSECSSRKRKSDAGGKSKKKKIRKLTDVIDEYVVNDLYSSYCWMCHTSDTTLRCSFCPRQYHSNCIDGNVFDLSQAKPNVPSNPISGILAQSPLATPSNSQLSNVSNSKSEIICPECIVSMLSECNQYGRASTQIIPQNDLKEMMLYIVLRLFHYSGAMHFQEAVDDKNYRDYNKIIKNPMYLKLLKQKIEEGTYHTIQQFYSDFKWIYHNCAVYNGDNYITSCARNLTSLGSKEINFIESCPQCFKTRLPFMVRWLKDSEVGAQKTKLPWKFSFDSIPVQKMWITELCDILHPLVWVRLQGYPTWPGKLLSIDDENALVLFFGDYDLNMVPVGSMCMHSNSSSKQNLLYNGTSEDSASVKEQNSHSSKKNNLFSNLLETKSTIERNSSSDILKEYRLALEQMQLHIENIKLKYPHFAVPHKKYENSINRCIEYYRKMSRRKHKTDDNHSNNGNGGNHSKSNNQTPYSRQISIDSSTKSISKYNMKSEYAMIIPKLQPTDPNNLILSKEPENFVESFEINMSKLVNEFKVGFDVQVEALVEQKTKILEEKISHLEAENIKNKRPNTTEVSTQANLEIKEVQKPIETKLIPKIIKKHEIDKEKLELIRYIKYLESQLTIEDSEIKRQEVLGALRYEELCLESMRQQKEMKKIIDNDVRSVLIQASHKFKKNEWCAYCGKNALFFCCWNTCYCNSECQMNHWMIHKSQCAQMSKNSSSNTSSSSTNSANTTAHPPTTVTIAPTTNRPITVTNAIPVSIVSSYQHNNAAANNNIINNRNSTLNSAANLNLEPSPNVNSMYRNMNGSINSNATAAINLQSTSIINRSLGSHNILQNYAHNRSIR